MRQFYIINDNLIIIKPSPSEVPAMQDNYIRVSDDVPRMPHKNLLIVGYVSQVILYILIIIYCIISPSLFSTLSLIYMLVSFALIIATPYYVQESPGNNRTAKVFAYPVQRISASIFTAINVGAFIFKLIVCVKGSQSSYSTNAQQFLQIQSLLNMFLPLLLLPFSALCIVIRTRTRNIQHFKHQINTLVTIPIFLAMGILILLLQIFSISVAGFLFFICMMIIFVQRKIDFSSIVSWILVLIVQILCLLFFAANFLATTNIILAFQVSDIFRFYGIDGINNFLVYDTSRGYVICLLLLFFTCCFVQRIFVYNNIWMIATNVYHLGEVKQSHIFMEQGVNFDSNANRTTERGPLVAEEQPMRTPKRYSLQVLELQQLDRSFSQNQSFIKNNENNRQFNMTQIPLQKKNSEQPKRTSSLDVKKSKKPTPKLIFDYFLIGINKFVDFIYSTQFSLRFTEIVSIVVIQRYNNIYSFVAVLWLALVASTDRIKIIYFVTLFILLPVEIGNYVILYAYNAPESPIGDLQNLSEFGFQTMQLFWLDIIIFNAYLFYMITFLLAASHDKNRSLHRKSSIPSSRALVLICSFVFRYSYLLTIAAMFFLGFSKVTLMNLVYVVLFLVFFSSGENVLVEIKTRNQKPVTTLTTFSRKFWFIIVYYTLICIILKYIYFLFFHDNLKEALQPTGINEQYHWSFNFSLSSICLSNTSPLFIIFVLSEAQIMIYRSAIYLNYSFSLVSQVTDVKNPRKNRFRIWLNTATQLILQFYYQSLWYISGLVILICSYRWNIMSLCIIFVTCLGLMRGFNKVMLAFIVFMDLTNIILNYLVLFTTYEVSQNFIGETGLSIVDQISLFLGLIISSNNNLSGVFALNIIIFYFAVESYALKKILQEERFNDQILAQRMQLESARQQSEDVEIKQDTISSYEPTVLQQESSDLQFAKNFNKNVIIATKKLYATVLWRKYKGWLQVCRFMSIFSTDMITIFVLVCCLCFRLSVSMFYFLFLYMIYYFVLFNRIGQLMQQQQFYQRIQREYSYFKSKQAIICDKQNSRSIITGQQSSTAVIAFIISTKQKAIRMRYKWRYILWFYTTIINIGCIILTYTAQFILSDFYIKYINPSFPNLASTIQNMLFVVGVSVTNQTSLFRQVYFYYFMVIFAVVEKLVLGFIKDIKEQQALQKQPSRLNRKQIKDLQDPIHFVDTSLGFIESVHRSENFIVGHNQSKFITEQQDQMQDFSKESNILIYFDYKEATIKINYLYGVLMFMLRFYLLVMLINLYQKSNIFAFAYLFSVLYFWFQKLHFKMVKNINKIAIVILLLQYVILLFDINPNTSSLPLPNAGTNLSILSMFITNKEWVDYLVVDFNKSSIGSYLLSFLTSAILIFLTQLYFTLFFFISKNCMEMIREVYDRYEYIGETLSRMPDQDTVYLNFANYKNWGYRVMKMSYELLINNSYIFISYLILILLSGIHNYISLGLVCFACIYIYLGIFTGFSEDKNIYTYTTIFFRIVQGILFLVLIAITVAEIPVFEQQSAFIHHIESLSNIEQIFLLFLIQIWLDLSVSAEFKQATNEYNNRVINRENVMIKSIAYQQNKDLIERLLKRYKQAMWFQINLKNALDIIDQWHAAMYKQKNFQLQNLKKGKNQQRIKSIEEDIKKARQRRPEQDEDISQILLQYLDNKTSVALKCGYYQIMKYVVFNNHRLINIDHTSIDIWDYILQNYEKLNQRIKEADQQIDFIIKAIQAEDFRRRMERLQEIKKQQFSQQKGNLNQLIMGIIKTPRKIFLDIKQKQNSTSRIVLLFVMSNFPYILSFFTWIYYMINPCLLSLPFIIYFFAFQIISDRKLTSIMLIYIFSIIIMALELQIQEKQNVNKPPGFLSWRKYLFYQHEDGTYMYAVGYLFFIFILIFINEEIKKYQGNKFKHHHEAQNRFRGAFRILLNEDSGSQHYLWDLIDDQNDQEKQCNPMHYVSIKIEETPQILSDCPLPGFIQSFNQGKTGIDLYPLIATVQIFLTIYLIFFYPLMTQSSTTDLQQSFKYFQFSSQMVLAVLMHVLSIVIERLITLISPENKNKSLIKYLYTMLIMTLFLIFIYFIAPTSKTVNGVYHPSNFLIAFAFFYFFYFFLSALQIRIGYKKYKSLNSLLTKRRMFNSLFVTIFTSVPFLYQLKLMMDYGFTTTSLKIFDWFRLYSIYLAAFKAKMQYFTATGVVLGEPQGLGMKSVGLVGFIAILVIIFGPMVLFSGLNPIAQPNLVIGGALELGIQIQGGNYFQLYSTSHFSAPPLIYTPQLFESQNFSQVPALQVMTAADIPQQFQLVRFQPYSDTNWGISYPNMEVLTNLMNETITQLANNKKPSNNFTIYVKYALNRRVTETIAADTNFAYPSNGSLTQIQLESIYKSITQCNQPTFLPGFYISLIRLFTVGNTYKPRPIVYYNSTNQDPYLEGVYLTLFCDSGNSTSDTSNVYWGLVSTNSSNPDPNAPTQSGIFLNVFCDKYQNLIAGLGFTALYTSVILVVAGFIRSLFENKIPDIIYFQNPKPDNVIQISQAIGTLRDRKQFRQQYLMYYQLIDIIRSPDLMKYLSGSYPNLIQQADEKRKKQQQDKEMSKKNKIQ